MISPPLTEYLLPLIDHNFKDQALFDILYKFTDEVYTRRVRSNALLFLFHNKYYHKKALSLIGTFVTSRDYLDRNAVAFLVGELNIKGMLPFVLEHSISNNHANSTPLVALLKLGHPEAARLVSEYMVRAQEHDAKMIINQLSAVSNKNIRYKVYHQVLMNFPDFVSSLLNYLSNSNRDFDSDTQMIYTEASRLGIKIKLTEEFKPTLHLTKVA